MSIETTDIVRALHLAVFGSYPQPEAVDTFVADIADDPAALDALAKRFGDFAAHMRRGERRSLADHSQDGEFRILLRELVHSGARHRVIVDVGANGLEGSNSFDLLTEFGWKGLLIEANPALIPRIKLAFGPTDHVLVECAIGVETGRMPLYLGISGAISSLIEASPAQLGPVTGQIEVEVKRLGDVLDAHHIQHDFDILSLDIEGMDVPVFNDLIAKTAYRPALVSIEGSWFGRTQKLADIGLSEAVASIYDIVGKTTANLILRRR